MSIGTQANLKRYLENEYNIEVSRESISKLCRGKDYRIIKTPKGIKIEETAKLLHETGFGKTSKAHKLKNNNKNTSENNKPTDQTLPVGDLSIESPREEIERHKAYHQAEKERISNEIKLKKLLNRDECIDTIFDLFKNMSNMLQSIPDKTAIKVRSSESDHEATQILKDEIHRILSILSDPEKPEEDIKKKIYSILMK